MNNRYYRIISRETFDRAPVGGIKGTRESQRWNSDGTHCIVERVPELDVNERWVDEAEALAIVAEPEWNDPNPFPQIPETDGQT